MWPPCLRRQAATRTLKLLPTFLQVARGTCCTYSVTCLFKASSVLGLALYTSSFAAPHSQKSRGFRSGLWGAHSTSLFSAINLPGNSSFRYLIVPWAVWGGAPSCWYQAWRYVNYVIVVMLTTSLLSWKQRYQYMFRQFSFTTSNMAFVHISMFLFL